jgi:outer membrane protein assembly factor BamB
LADVLAADSSIYVWRLDGVVWTIDRHTGALAWQDTLSANARPQAHSEVAVVDGAIYRGAGDGTIQLLTPAYVELAVNPAQLLVGAVTNGGNFRTAAQRATPNVIGQVCPGDQVLILEQTYVGSQLWYRVRVTANAASCHPERVQAGSSGWVSSALVRLR